MSTKASAVAACSVVLFLLLSSAGSLTFPSHRSLQDLRKSSRDSSTRLYGPVMVDQGPTSGGTRFRTRNVLTDNSLVGMITVKEQGNRKICVLCHGLLGSKDQGIIRKLAEDLPVNTCRFDFSGNGESEGPFRYAGYDNEVQDIRAIVEYLRGEGWDVTAILGHSKGAHAVLRYAWTFDDVPKVISLSGRFDFSNQPKTRFSQEQMDDMEQKGHFVWSVRGKDYTVTRSDFLERGDVDMAAHVPLIRNSHVLVLHGDQDETIPVADAYVLDRSLAKSKLYILKGASHFFLTPEEVKDVVKAVSEYLLEPSSANDVCENLG